MASKKRNSIKLTLIIVGIVLFLGGCRHGQSLAAKEQFVPFASDLWDNKLFNDRYSVSKLTFQSNGVSIYTLIENETQKKFVTNIPQNSALLGSYKRDSDKNEFIKDCLHLFESNPRRTVSLNVEVLELDLLKIWYTVNDNRKSK